MKTINLKWLWPVVFVAMTLAFLLAATVAFGQGVGAAQVEQPASGWAQQPPLVLIGSAVLGLMGILIVVYLVFILADFLPAAKKTYAAPEYASSPVGKMVGIITGDTTALTGKHADVVMEGHDYDGIHEFDNDLPPWWKYLFYATIVFSVAYMLHFHVFQSGMRQDDEYRQEMHLAAMMHPSLGGEGEEGEELMFLTLTDGAALENGKAIYLQNCSACHGQQGEGTIGPNLTDEYWLHGGDVNSIFKTIKYGVPSKGMVPWQGKLSQDQILEVSSYILSLQGTTPPNAKAPQGEKL